VQKQYRLRSRIVTNRTLTLNEDTNLFAPLLAETRERLKTLSGDDEALLWALRRKLYTRLTYDERGSSMQRQALKQRKRKEQEDKCAECKNELPEKNVVLDRLEGMKGYTVENTRLLCQSCDYLIQEQRRFK
jgi:hypothetical protein